MKLRGLPNRAYNILFHTHTVSGIVLSAALFIIFYAGAFTLFKAEFYSWENPEMRHKEKGEFSLPETLAAIEKLAPKIDWDDDLRITLPSASHPTIRVYGHLETNGGPEEHFQLELNPQNYAEYSSASTTGETLYRLHFLDQIPLAGRYLAGFVSLFFIFATLTGVLIHWRNIFTKFWSFSLKGTKKQLWTNAHTALGMLGLPFQLMYAITGAFYLLLPLVLLPAVALLFNGDVNKIYQIVYPSFGVQYEENAAVTDNRARLEGLYQQVIQDNTGAEVNYLAVKHFNREDAAVDFSLKTTNPENFDNYGSAGYRIATGEELYSLIPQKNKTYVNQVINGMAQLHFGTFGGVLLKTVYFLLALLTCLVIIAGVLLWREARKNKNYSPKQQRFHARVTLVYLALCLSLIPAVPLLFSAELLVPQSASHSTQVNSLFFGSWLALFLLGLVLKEDGKLTRVYLLISGFVSILLPAVNGFTTGDWLWVSLSQRDYHVFGTDAFWLLWGLISAYLGIQIRAGRKSGGFIATPQIKTEPVSLPEV